MRFYVPEWEDHVDAHYDFEHDEHSAAVKDDRELHYIWDIFDYETTPIDGVLISREQVEDSRTKFDRLIEHGLHDEAGGVGIPEWLPTISDCGAWGYKALPFPRYGNEEMLEFYEQLGVSVGVTIDHLVLGTGKEARVYLDKRAFQDDFSQSELPEPLTEEVDVMVDTWPDQWPTYVEEYEPSICGVSDPSPFDPSLFEESVPAILDRLEDDPRAVVREDDTKFRYELTLENAEEMHSLYEAGDYPFRLMVAIQGWDPISYADAADAVLRLGYDYLGIGGVAGSNADEIRRVVSEVGTVVKRHERAHSTRVDTHLFGFAKTDAFETVGRGGVTSFDSASMLRSAWTGGKNYHLDSDQRYDALRVRFPSNGEPLSTSIEKALRGQEVLHGLRAFDTGESIADAIREWHRSATPAITELEPYLEAHRWDDRYDQSRLVDMEAQFREDFAYASELNGDFSGRFRKRFLKLLRRDDPDDPVPFDEYTALIEEARSVFDETFPRMADELERRERDAGAVGTFAQVWVLVEDYVTWIGDESYLDAYEDLLRREPWRECPCPICQEYGIEVAIFRGNNRNRRRGFHNTRRFYDEFERQLPKVLVVTKATAGLSGASSVESYLRTTEPAFWEAVHDLPVAEIGTVSAKGVHEWWDRPPSTVSLDPRELGQRLGTYCVRYQDLFVYGPDGELSEEARTAVETNDCTVHDYADPEMLRKAVLDRLGYDAEFLPSRVHQSGLTEFN